MAAWLNQPAAQLERLGLAAQFSSDPSAPSDGSR
jgi:hypothetical protein